MFQGDGVAHEAVAEAAGQGRLPGHLAGDQGLASRESAVSANRGPGVGVRPGCVAKVSNR